MKNVRKLFLLFASVAALTLTGCLHILEDVTVRKDGSGTYRMEIDMSELKGMMDMLEGMDMGGDSTAIAEDEEGGMEEGFDPSISQLGEEIGGVATSLEGMPGLSNVHEINDTSSFKFGYSFDFENIQALNNALNAINREKGTGVATEGNVFTLKGKKFTRLAVGNLGDEIKKAMSDGEEGEEGMDMVKMFFSDMTYKQVYHFPDRTIKKSSNDLSEISDGNHTLTITIKPFDEEQMNKDVSVGTVVKLK